MKVSAKQVGGLGGNVRDYLPKDFKLSSKEHFQTNKGGKRTRWHYTAAGPNWNGNATVTTKKGAGVRTIEYDASFIDRTEEVRVERPYVNVADALNGDVF